MILKNIYSIFLFLMILLTACSTDQPEYAISQQIKLSESIRSFEFLRSETEKILIGGFKEARIGLNAEKKIVSFKNIAFEWNARLNNVKYQLETMQQDLSEIKEEAAIYFKKLQAITDSIKDENIRKLEIKHNRIFKKEWNEIFGKGEKAMNELFKITQKGRDVHKVIINDGLRQEGKNSLQAIQALQKEYRSSFDTLFVFTCAAIKKISVKNADVYPVCDSTREERLKKNKFQ